VSCSATSPAVNRSCRRDLARIVATASELGMYTNLVTSAIGLSRRPGGGAQDRRPRPRPGQHPGRRTHPLRPDRPHPVLRPQDRGRPHGDGHGLAAHGERRAAPAEQSTGVPRHPRTWPRSWAPGGSSWPTPSTTAGACSTARPLLPSRAQLERPRRWSAPHGSAWRAGWTSCTSCPTTTAATRSPAWALGQPAADVAPNGDALPCPAAQSLPLPRASVREESLARIWTESPLFQSFRGTDWMPDPCRSCDRREIDFGGCRCQAFQLTGDPARTDPVCHLSPGPRAGGAGRARGQLRSEGERAAARADTSPARPPARGRVMTDLGMSAAHS